MELESLKKRLYGELVFEELKYDEYVYFHAGPRSKQHKTCGNEIKNSKGIRENFLRDKVTKFTQCTISSLEFATNKIDMRLPV